VRVARVTKRFGAVVAVAALDLAVERGSFATLLGPSGCGKTTTLHMIAGFHEPDEGEIYIGGRPQRGVMPHRRRVGVVFQEYALFPHMSVFDNVAYGLRVRRLGAEELARRVRATLEQMELAGLERRFPQELSGGQQQRVALARALVLEPEVLLMDEPLSNLDAQLRVRVRAEIRDLQRRLGITTIYVTHDQEEALSISDRVAVMHLGVLQQYASPPDLYYRPANRFVAGFVGTANFVPAERVDAPAGAPCVRVGPQVLTVTGAAGPPGAPVTLVVRPEWIALAPAADAAPLRGHVEDASFLGTTVRYRVRVPALDHSLVVDDPHGPGKPVASGLVGLTLKDGAPYILPEGGT
jgi:ABC-type Fe3+/spermidine/putrescine transport system ATPase subunit